MQVDAFKSGKLKNMNALESIHMLTPLWDSVNLIVTENCLVNLIVPRYLDAIKG